MSNQQPSVYPPQAQPEPELTLAWIDIQIAQETLAKEQQLERLGATEGSLYRLKQFRELLNKTSDQKAEGEL